jgi:hypothetical protein
MAKGDDAIAGTEEYNITSHRFPPDPNNDRRVKFEGEYLAITKEETEETKILVEKVEGYKEFEVPKGYTTYIRGCKKVCFFKA